MALIACYCRVSTRHQKNDSQRVEIERWLRNNQMDVSAVQWFEDKESATASRRLRDGINLLADWCERGVRVVAVTQQIDLS